MDKIKIIRRITKKLVSAPGAPGGKTGTQHPVPDNLTEEFNVPFRGRDGNELYADIYMPKETGGEKLPVIVIVHGGGLFAGKPAAERGAAEVFARKGYLVFVPSYRMLMDANACEEISDICAGFDFAGQEAESRGGDPDRVFVIAESAGAFLAEYAAAMQKSEKLCGQIGYEPPDTVIRAIAFVSGMFYTTRKDPLGMFYPSAIYGERIKDDGFMAYMDPENAEVIKKSSAVDTPDQQKRLSARVYDKVRRSVKKSRDTEPAGVLRRKEEGARTRLCDALA